MYVRETYMYTIYPYVYTLARHTDYTYTYELFEDNKIIVDCHKRYILITIVNTGL